MHEPQRAVLRACGREGARRRRGRDLSVYVERSWARRAALPHRPVDAQSHPCHRHLKYPQRPPAASHPRAPSRCVFAHPLPPRFRAPFACSPLWPTHTCSPCASVPACADRTLLLFSLRRQRMDALLSECSRSHAPTPSGCSTTTRSRRSSASFRCRTTPYDVRRGNLRACRHRPIAVRKGNASVQYGNGHRRKRNFHRHVTRTTNTRVHTHEYACIRRRGCRMRPLRRCAV